MVRLPGLCPHCHNDHVIKGGKIKTGKPRYTCAPPDCPRYALQLKLTYTGRLPASKSTSWTCGAMAVACETPHRG